LERTCGQCVERIGNPDWPADKGDQAAQEPAGEHRCRTHRWVIERTITWLGGYRRLALRYEPHGYLFAAFLALAGG
jgi:transposase